MEALVGLAACFCSFAARQLGGDSGHLRGVLEVLGRGLPGRAVTMLSGQRDCIIPGDAGSETKGGVGVPLLSLHVRGAQSRIETQPSMVVTTSAS